MHLKPDGNLILCGFALIGIVLNSQPYLNVASRASMSFCMHTRTSLLVERFGSSIGSEIRVASNTIM